jgi:hypothetical protein
MSTALRFWTCRVLLPASCNTEVLFCGQVKVLMTSSYYFILLSRCSTFVSRISKSRWSVTELQWQASLQCQHHIVAGPHQQ